MATIPNVDSDPDEKLLSFGTAGQQRYNVRRIQLGDGYSQRSLPGINSKPQQWKLVWTRISDADTEMLRAFFESLGAVDLVEWAPYGQTDVLKWTANDWSNQPSGYLVQDCSITLTQEFDL